MGKKFFSGWELWQQMTFVLACGIVATLILGLCKLQYDRYRLRKYSKVDKGKKVQTPEMLEAQPISSEPKDEGIPFGIRAIESGIEVDGVWISRSNTPVGSSRSSINDVKLPRSGSSSQLEFPKAAQGSSSRDSSRAPSSAFDRAVSAERIPTNDSRDSSPNRNDHTSSRGPPIAFNTRYSNSNLTRNSMTLHALEGMDLGPPFSARYELQSSQNSSSNSGKSSRNSGEFDYMTLTEGRPYEAAYINPRQTSVLAPVDPRTDLDLLQSHRLSHVAETGQLTPRVRRPGNSGEWASMADNMRFPQDVSTTNGVDYFAPRQKTPSPPLPPVAIPPEDIPIPSASKYNQDGHMSNQARQAVPLLETYTTQAKQVPTTYQPRGPQHTFEEEPMSYEVQTMQNQRQSQVLRKVNSGFEILRPGTFGEPPSPEEESPAPSRASEKRQSRRLQKKRRSSSFSRSSHFVEQV